MKDLVGTLARTAPPPPPVLPSEDKWFVRISFELENHKIYMKHLIKKIIKEISVSDVAQQ